MTTPDSPFDEVVRLAHVQALDAAACHASRATADHEARREIDVVQRELDAVTAELQRLRALPELKVGQRARRLARMSRCEAPVAEVPLTATDSNAPRPSITAGAVVVVRNRREPLSALLAMFAEAGVEDLEIVDDASIDPATVGLLDSLDTKVHRMPVTLGAAGPWAYGIMARMLVRQPTFLVVGEALPTASIRDEVVERMLWELDRHHVPIGLPIIDEVGEGLPAMFRLYPQASLFEPEVRPLDPPYVAQQVRAGADRPEERFARIHDAP